MQPQQPLHAVIETVWLASEMAVFARVHELGSFTAAARALGVPKVAVSRAIQSLERRLKVQLLTRTTRRMALTDAGRVVLPYCQQVLAAADAARSAVSAEDLGPLRVLTDNGYGRLLVAPLVPRFLEHYPDSPLQVELVDRLPTEPGSEWDLLIASEVPASPALAATDLGTPPLILCAAPAYLRRAGMPGRPQQLAEHALLVAGPGGKTELRLQRGGSDPLSLVLAPKLAVDDPAVVHAAAAAGLGIALLPEFLCRQGLSMGRLERVLAGWQVADSLRLHALYDPRRVASQRIRRFIDFLLANMVPVLGKAG
jgi:LysR family transcriptional regulator for bpeEF and oprC